MSKSPLPYAITLPSLVVIGIAVVKMFWICNVISQDHAIKGSHDFVWEPLKISHHPAKSADHRKYDNGDIMLLVVEEQNFTRSLNFAITIFL